MEQGTPLQDKWVSDPDQRSYRTTLSSGRSRTLVLSYQWVLFMKSGALSTKKLVKISGIWVPDHRNWIPLGGTRQVDIGQDLAKKEEWLNIAQERGSFTSKRFWSKKLRNKCKESLLNESNNNYKKCDPLSSIIAKWHWG